MDGSLNLHEGPRGATISNLGVEFHSPSLWFWIKAGIGFTFGAGVVYVMAYTLWILLLVNVAAGFLRILRH